MFKRIESLFVSIRKAASRWTWVQYLIDAGSSIAIPSVVAWIAKMPWTLTILVVIGVAMMATGIIEWIRRGTESPQRLRDAKTRIVGLVSLIRPEGPDIVPVAALLALSTGLPPPGDWKAEAVASLRAMVVPEIVDDFRVCLNDVRPDRSATHFLVALSENLTRDDLRCSVSKKPPATQS